MAQSLAFSYKLGQTSDDVRVAIVKGGHTIIWFVLAAGAIYVACILRCTALEARLRRDAVQALSVISVQREVGIARAIIVFLSTAVAAVGLWLNL